MCIRSRNSVVAQDILMATLFPPYALDPDQFASASERVGLLRERETLQSLATTLPPSYTVFHSTHLAWREDGRLRKREADFLVVNQAGEALMVEQKTGRLEETLAGLTKSYDGHSKSVVTQCHEIVDSLRGRFRDGYGVSLKIDFLLFCPDHVVRNPAIAGLAPQQIVDAPKRRALVQTIRRLLPEGRPDADRFAKVRAMLSQDLALTVDPHAQAAEGVRLMTRLTDGLLDFLTGLEMAPYRLRVDGAAGCGKTQMVCAFAERWRATGQRVLVACFNRPLADELRAALSAEVTVDTVHGIARRLLESGGAPIDIAARATEQDFWSEMLAKAIDVALDSAPHSLRFDALVVDEGQDMQPDGYELLHLLLPEDGDIIWLEDENQRLYSTPPVTAAGFVMWRCRDNYRSPQRIARFLQAALPVPFVARNPLHGDPVFVHDIAPASLIATLGARIERLRTAGYEPDQIVVLTGRGQTGSVVMQAEMLGPYVTRRAAGFTPDGTARYTAGELRVETLWRFKGQQAPAILLCEFDGDLADQATIRRLYCAATRATAHLEIFVPKGSALLPQLHQAAGRANGAVPD
jgi:AAA domain